MFFHFSKNETTRKQLEKHHVVVWIHRMFLDPWEVSRRKFLSMLRCSSACQWNFKVWRSWAPQRTEKHKNKLETILAGNEKLVNISVRHEPEKSWSVLEKYEVFRGKVKDESKHTFYDDCDCLGRDGATKCEALFGQGTHGAPAWRTWRRQGKFENTE